jgi:hypothetical protein
MERVPVPEDAVFRLVDVVERVGVPYAMMGGLALNAWGIPRATYDLDAALAVESGNIVRILTALRGDDVEVEPQFLGGYLDELAGMQKADLRLHSAESWFTVDVFFSTTPFLRSAVKCRVELIVSNRSIRIITAADLILFRLIAGRRKDWVDVDNIVAVEGVPESEYLHDWAGRLGVKERLDRVLREAGRG